MAIRRQKNTASLNASLADGALVVARTMGRVAQSWSHRVSDAAPVEFFKPPVSPQIGSNPTATLHVLVSGYVSGERVITARPVYSDGRQGSPLATLTVDADGWHTV